LSDLDSEAEVESGAEVESEAGIDSGAGAESRIDVALLSEQQVESLSARAATESNDNIRIAATCFFIACLLKKFATDQESCLQGNWIVLTSLCQRKELEPCITFHSTRVI
jgi:hypothetical protein